MSVTRTETPTQPALPDEIVDFQAGCALYKLEGSPPGTEAECTGRCAVQRSTTTYEVGADGITVPTSGSCRQIFP